MAKKSTVHDHRVYNVTVTICPAEDKSGEWISHVLEFDIVSQGSTPLEARNMAREAASMIVIDDLNAGRDPHARSAPLEHWKKLEKALAGTTARVDLRTVDAKDCSKLYLTTMILAFELVHHKHDNVILLEEFRKQPRAEVVDRPRTHAQA